MGAGGKEVGRIAIRVVPDLTGFREELEAKLKSMEDGLKAKVHVEIDKDGAAAKMRALMGELKAEAAKNVKVHVDVDVDRHRLRNMLGRLGEGGSGGGGGFGGGFSGGLGSIGNFGSPANAIALAMLLPPALALAAPALASLPALLSAVTMPIGTLALGMDGLKKAAEDAGVAIEGKDKKGRPNGKLTVGGALKELQEGVSDVFEKGFTPILKQLISVSPQVTTALKGVAGGIVNLAQGAVKALVSPAAQNQLNTLSANIGGMLSAAAPGLQSFTTGLINMATQVSTHFPGLSKWFNELGDKFSKWVDKISADGTLDKGIAGLRPVMDRIVDFLGALLDAGMKLAADGTMQNNIDKVLDSIKELVTKALPDLTNFFNTLAPIIHDITKLLPAGHDPVLNPKKDANGNPLPPGSADPNIVPGSRNAFSPGVRKGSPLDTWPKWMDEHVGGPIMRFFQGKTQNQQSLNGQPDFGGLLRPFTSGSAFQGLDKAASGAGNFLQGASGFNEAMKVRQQIVNEFKALPGQLSGVWKEISSAASKAWDELVQAASTAKDKVVAFLKQIPGEVSKLAGEMASAGANLIQGLINGIGSMAGAAVNAAKGVVKSAIDGAKSLLGIKSPSTVFHGIGVNTMEGLTNGLNDGGGSAIERAKTLAQSIADAMNGGLEGINGKAVSQQVKEIMAELDLQRDKLKVQEDSLPKGDKAGRQGIRDQLAQLQSARDQLRLESDQLGFDTKHGKNGASSDSMTEAAQYITQSLAKALDTMKSFAMANVQQFESDLGISGKGAIPVIAEQGLAWAQGLLGHQINSAFGLDDKQGGNVHIHVNSVDEAMAAHRNALNKQAMTYAGR
ncbi:MAG: phage tail protein [Isosphaeraceae bacterium]